MPLGRYLLVVSSLLLVLLFVADWYLPSPSPMTSYGAPMDEAILHIRSEHKWPQRLQFDTTAPAMLPTSSPIGAAMPAEDPKLNTLAEARPPETQVIAKPRPHVATRHRNRAPAETTRFAVNPAPSSLPQDWWGE